MKKLLSSIFRRPQQFQQLNLCPHHLKKDAAGQQMMNMKQPIPYSTDNCQTCNEHLCLVCSETHVTRHCLVRLNTMKQIGTGVLKNFNLGEVIKVDLRNLKCICGKPLNKGAAICAACGMASCSEQCHKQWEKLGNCKFADNFYNIPEGFNMRSILFDNIEKIQKSKAKQWVIANKSSTTMICCYATSIQPYVFLQRGYRNYGIPNRRCDCDCDHCQIHPGHSSTNCQSSCLNFDLQFMKYALMDPKNHKQCTCSCNFCQSGVIFNTHRLIDCMPFCKRSSYSKEER